MIRKLLQFFSGSDASAKPKGWEATTKPSPEAMCEINPSSMSREEIKTHLANLYRRHNQAASSLNPELRREAEDMLDAIVQCRELYVESY